MNDEVTNATARTAGIIKFKIINQGKQPNYKIYNNYNLLVHIGNCVNVEFLFVSIDYAANLIDLLFRKR